MTPRFALLLALAIAGSLSCGSRVAGPPSLPEEDVRVTMTLSSDGGPTGPLNIRIEVMNAGRRSVITPDPCPEPYIRFYDGQMTELYQRNPTMPVACPVSLYAPLRTGERWELSYAFDGTYYSATGERLEAVPGTYHVIATLTYALFEPPEAPARIVTREASFVWR